MYHSLHPTIAELNSADLRRSAHLARRAALGRSAITVVETTPAPTPVGRDPFLDGLDGAVRRGREQRGRVLASLVTRPDRSR